jgi:alpha/beta superfamily hydrolase
MYFVIAHHNLSQVEDAYSRAAKIVERVVPDADNAKMISISPSLSGSYRFAFLLDWKSPGILTTADAEKYQGFDLVDYLVVFENILQPENFSVIYTTNEFQILKRD